MKRPGRQRGSILLIAIALIVSVALLATAFTAIQVGDTASSADHAVSSQALYVAEAGLSNALENYRTGTACGAIALNNIAFGNGSFTATGSLHQPAGTTLTAAINATAAIIPVVSTAGYSPHGRITVEAEQIDYTGVTATSFTGAKRGVNGTTAAAHANGRPVSQDLCRVRSTGTVGAGVRVVEATVGTAGGGNTRSNFLDTGASGFITTANNPRTTLGSLASPTFGAGTNTIIAAVALENTINTRYDVTPPGISNPPIPYLAGGWLRLRRGNTNLATNTYQVNVGSKENDAAPSAQSFTREMMFLLGRQTGVPANPIYYVDARASSNSPVNGRITGEVKMVVINNPPSSDRRARSVNNVTVGGTNIYNNQQFTVPAGDRVIVVAVQLFNTINDDAGAIDQVRTIPAGAVQLRKGNAGGPILAQNEFPIDLTSDRSRNTFPLTQRIYAANRSTSILLVARDPTGVNNQRYTIRVAVAPYGGGQSRVSANAQVLVIGLNANLNGEVVDGVPTAVGTGATVIGALNATFGAGDQVVIAPVQYANGPGADRSIAAGNELLVYNGAPQTASQYNLTFCASGTSVLCDDFASGLMSRNAFGGANPTLEVRASSNLAGVNSVMAEAKILALNIPTGIALIDWIEVFQ